MEHECPSDQGEYGLVKVVLSPVRGHPLNASLACAAATSAQFDDPNLVSCAGLVPVMALARAGLAGWSTSGYGVPGRGANAG